jgi:sigma-E factor negative regulatory protein RseB
VNVSVDLQGHRSVRRSLWRLPLACLVWSAPLVAWAQPQQRLSFKMDPAGLLTLVQQAMQQRSYAGTLIYSAPEGVFSSKLTRLVSGSQVWEHMESLDGPQQRVFRHNDTVHTIWPSQRVITVERHGATGESLGFAEIDPRLRDSYDLKFAADERVAGRETRVLVLKPRDDQRFSQRLWIDRQTYVVLRADIMNATGKVLESVFFSNVDLDARVTRDQTINPAKRLEGFRTVQMISDATTLDAEGWVPGTLPSGFRPVGCVRRPMGDPQQQPDGKPVRVIQAVFSDGLARVSLFVEPADTSKSMRTLSTHLGATHTIRTTRDERWWVTVMGDLPLQTLKAFADSVTRRS